MFARVNPAVGARRINLAGGEGNDPSGDAMSRPPSILKIEGPTWTHALPWWYYEFERGRFGAVLTSSNELPTTAGTTTGINSAL